MQDSHKPSFGPKSLFSAIYDWVNTCDSIPNFDGVMISFIVFLCGLLVMGYCMLTSSISHFSRRPTIHPTYVYTNHVLNAADAGVESRFGRPRRPETSADKFKRHYSPQELFGQASAAPIEGNN